MKNTMLLSAFACAALACRADEADSICTIRIDEVSVYSYKTFDPAILEPVALSQLTGTVRQVQQGPAIPASLPGLTALAPNFYMPDYGSKLSSALYIRGVGSRMNDPAVGMYFDNVPLLDKGMYDFDLWDISRIDIIRGPQGALYGRNSMGGILSLYTPSPLSGRQTRASVDYGNANSLSVTASHRQPLGQNMGLSVGASWRQSDGFFTNEYTGKSADATRSGSARLRFDWRFAPRWTAEFALAAEKSTQDGYAYGRVDDAGHIADPDYNAPAGYDRRWLLGSAHLRYLTDKISFASTTSYQHFDDRMTLDQDFTPADLFTMRQIQNQNAATQELILKSEGQRAYRWLFGAFGFYKGLQTQAPVELKKDFFASMFPTLNPPMFVGASDDCNSRGFYDTPSWGAAVFHKSEYHTGDFTFAGEVRLDYERVSIDHNTTGSLPIEVRMPPTFQPAYYTVSVKMTGDDSQTFLQFSPKATVKWTPFERKTDRLYASVSRGYRAGGYNIQLFSDLVKNQIQAGGQQIMTQRSDVTIESTPEPHDISYKPEYSWNYEVGGRKQLWNNVTADFALFYIDTYNQQVTQFVQSSLGRVTRNAARSASYGVEVWAHGIFGEWAADLSWGYTHATFRNYRDTVKVDGVLQPVNYKGNFVPFSPRHTLTAGLQREFRFRGGSWLESLSAGVRYTGAGKVFFTENNDASQDFYSLLSADVALKKGAFTLRLWGKNLTDSQYKTFFFHGIVGDFAQLGNPVQLGATLTFNL